MRRTRTRRKKRRLCVYTQLNDGGGFDFQTSRSSEFYQNIPCWNGAVVDCRMGGGEPFFGDPFCVNPEDNQSNQIIIIIIIIIILIAFTGRRHRQRFTGGGQHPAGRHQSIFQPSRFFFIFHFCLFVCWFLFRLVCSFSFYFNWCFFFF